MDHVTYVGVNGGETQDSENLVFWPPHVENSSKSVQMDDHTNPLSLKTRNQ